MMQQPRMAGPFPPKKGTPWWVWVLAIFGFLFLAGFAGCAACVYFVGQTPEACGSSKAACKACCKEEKKTGGYLESRRTRMNGTRYMACICD